MNCERDDGSIDWLSVILFVFMWAVIAFGAAEYCRQQSRIYRGLHPVYDLPSAPMPPRPGQ